MSDEWPAPSCTYPSCWRKSLHCSLRLWKHRRLIRREGGSLGAAQRSDVELAYLSIARSAWRHAHALLAACPEAQLIGLDRDPQALALARERLAEFADRITLVEARYDELPAVLAEARPPQGSRDSA